MLRPTKNIFSNSSKNVLLEFDPLIILPKNLTGLEWIKEIKDVKSDGFVDKQTEKRRVFIDLPSIITMPLDLSALKVRSAHFQAIVQWEIKFLAQKIMEDTMFRSSMKALIGSKHIYLDETVMWWLSKSILKLYSYQVKKDWREREREREREQTANIPRWCLCQLQGISRQKDYPGVVSFN